jgi:hypothetical protein
MFMQAVRALGSHARGHPEILPVLFLTCVSPSIAIYMSGHEFGAPDIIPGRAMRRNGATWNPNTVTNYEHSALDLRPGRRGWWPNKTFDDYD